MTAPKGNRFPLSILNPNPHFPETRPSKTALRVAMHRAAHQLLDNPKVFDDPLALAIIGPKAVARLDSIQTRYGEQVAGNLRALLAVRSRYAEDELAAQRKTNVAAWLAVAAKMGFRSIEDMDANAINARYFQDRSDELRVSSRLGRLMSAQIRGRVESVYRAHILRSYQREGAFAGGRGT